MSDQDNNAQAPNKQGEAGKTGETSKTPAIDMVSEPRSHHFSTEPLQFRIRGSSITGASPPMFISLEEIMRAAHGFQNMALAHEIAMEQDFKLEPFEPPDNSYQKLVKETLHRAYFDILREQLNSDPQEHSQALILLEDVKQGLFSILLPRHTRIRTMIEEVLDTEFIKQQAEHSSLDFQKYAKFVIDLMAKLAAPARDEMIQNITKLTDTVDVFRAILEALEVLKLDLANTLIAMIRPHVQAESVQYEKTKFEEMLKMQEDGLRYTKEWVIKHIDKTGLTIPVENTNDVRNITAQTLAKGYLELLEWDTTNPYPETLQLDASRFSDVGLEVFRLVCVASVLLVSPTCNGADASAANEFKKQLKDRIFIIVDNVSSDTSLKTTLPSVAEEVLASTEQLLERFNQNPLTNDVKELIRTQIISLGDPEHRIRQIVRQRILEFFKDILVCGGGSKQVPVGLSLFSHELKTIAGTLLRYVMHNKSVFIQYYMDIVQEELRKN